MGVGEKGNKEGRSEKSRWANRTVLNKNMNKTNIY